MNSKQNPLLDLRKPFERDRAFRMRHEILSPLVAFDLILQGAERSNIKQINAIKSQVLEELKKTRQGGELEELFRLTKASDQLREMFRPKFQTIVGSVIDKGEIDHGQLREFAEDLEGMMSESDLF